MKFTIVLIALTLTSNAQAWCYGYDRSTECELQRAQEQVTELQEQAAKVSRDQLRADIATLSKPTDPTPEPLSDCALAFTSQLKELFCK